MDTTAILSQKAQGPYWMIRNMSGKGSRRNIKTRYKRQNGRFEHPVGSEYWKGW
jgi:hypothetical protein